MVRKNKMMVIVLSLRRRWVGLVFYAYKMVNGMKNESTVTNKCPAEIISIASQVPGSEHPKYNRPFLVTRLPRISREFLVNLFIIIIIK